MQHQNKMSNNKGKSNDFKYLQQEVKRKQKAEEIVKAIQKIQNEPKEKKEPQYKTKHFKTYANSDRNIKAEIECDEQANLDAIDEIDLQKMEEEPQQHFSEEQEQEQEYDSEHSSVKDWSYPEIDDECEPTPIVHDFESRIYDLETKLSSAQEIIFQLLGGLFNHETQKQIVDNHMKFLYTGRGLTDEEVEESIWPTTRQGDANEERIQQLEENLDILVKRLKKGKPLHRFYRKFQKKVRHHGKEIMTGFIEAFNISVNR